MDRFRYTNIIMHRELEANTELPPTRQQLESEYDIYVPVGEKSCLKRFEDAFHTIEALVQKEEALASHWLTIRTPWDHTYDTLPDKAISEEEKDLGLLMLFNRVSAGIQERGKCMYSLYIFLDDPIHAQRDVRSFLCIQRHYSIFRGSEKKSR